MLSFVICLFLIQGSLNHHHLQAPPPAQPYQDLTWILNAVSLSSSRVSLGMVAPMLMAFLSIGASHRRMNLANQYPTKMVVFPPGVIVMCPARLSKVWNFSYCLTLSIASYITSKLWNIWELKTYFLKIPFQWSKWRSYTPKCAHCILSVSRNRICQHAWYWSICSPQAKSLTQFASTPNVKIILKNVKLFHQKVSTEMNNYVIWSKQSPCDRNIYHSENVAFFINLYIWTN